MEKKPSSFSFLFKRLNKRSSSGGGGGGRAGAWRWRPKSSAGFRWKRRFNLWLVDGLIFKIVSTFEAIIVVSKLCFFYLCCGGHF